MIYTQLADIPADKKRAIIAIGNFDGVHLGHQTVINAARHYADKNHVPLGVMMFDPHPRQFFMPDQPPFRLTQLATRAQLLQAQGVDFVLALPFDKAMASLPAEQFISDVLCRALQISAISVGFNFRFGKDRTGTPDLLEQAGSIHGFAVHIAAAFSGNEEEGDGVGEGDDKAYSSSAIRKALANGNVEQAKTMLGRFWAIEGEVKKGDQRGRTIGFPTANIELADYLHPAFGVYVIRANFTSTTQLAAPSSAPKYGVANIGMRPTVGTLKPRLEAHLFDFNADIYGQSLSIELLHFLRPEQKFGGLEALTQQIAKDSEMAQDYISLFSRAKD